MATTSNTERATMTDINGKTTLITGAARGMGREIAYRFGDRGARLALVDIDEENLEETARRLRRAGATVETFICDLSEPDNVVALREKVHEALGPVELLVNNAGVVQGGPLEEIDEKWDQLTMDVNIGAVHWMTKTFLPDLKKARSSHLVQMASAASFVGLPYQVMYCASKWFVTGYSEALRAELRKEGAEHVKMSIICPSLVDTGMFEGSEPPALTPILTPQFVADRVIEAVENEELYVKEPWMAKAAPLMQSLLPTRIVDKLADTLGATEIMHGWQGRGDGE